MEILNVKEVADYLSCSVSSIRNLVREKKLPCFRIGSKINFNKEAIDNWVHSQETNNTNIEQNECKIKKLNIRR